MNFVIMLEKEEILRLCDEKGIKIIKSNTNECLYRQKIIFWNGEDLNALNHEYEHLNAKSFFQAILIDLRVIFSNFNVFLNNLIFLKFERKNKKIKLKFYFPECIAFLVFASILLFLFLFLRHLV